MASFLQFSLPKYHNDVGFFNIEHYVIFLQRLGRLNDLFPSVFRIKIPWWCSVLQDRT